MPRIILYATFAVGYIYSCPTYSCLFLAGRKIRGRKIAKCVPMESVSRK